MRRRRRAEVRPPRRQEPGHRRVQRRRHAAPHPHRRPVDAARRERHGQEERQATISPTTARQEIVDKLILPTFARSRAWPDLLKGKDKIVWCSPAERPPKADDRTILLPHQPDRLLPRRRPARRLRPDGPEDHRGHLRRPRPARRRRLQRQGPDQGRPLGRLHVPLHRQEHRRRRPGRASARCSSPTPSAIPIRSTSGSTTNGTASRGLTDEPHRRADPQALQADAERHHRDAEPAPADLPRNGPPRPLRPRTGRIHLGEDRQGRDAAAGWRAGGGGRAGSLGAGKTDLDPVAAQRHPGGGRILNRRFRHERRTTWRTSRRISRRSSSATTTTRTRSSSSVWRNWSATST